MISQRLPINAKTYLNEICSKLSSHWPGRWRGPQCSRSLTSPAQISTTRHFIRWNITLTKALAQTGWKQKEWELTGQNNEIFYLGESEIFSIYFCRFPSWPIWLKMWICTTGDHNLQSTFVFKSLTLLNISSHFGEEGITMLTKCYYKFDGGVLKTLNLRMCKLTEKVFRPISLLQF